ncbi:hypothetical protein HNQ93_002320 [Hymenobacter luteus]|uniref:VCBS repeat-containing protein n=2 Tax=Hymenobacter TaxID=89966 RepID=A0A7W9T1X4_9BACT|nr:MULTISPECIES: hypothetical protein [Hymenobacter]MBB4602111.1 hypothetical protein [Hymenobacter latericoloratus]MBB6059460.1 hypothetical protein [Hymenobacter luteus]
MLLTLLGHSLPGLSQRSFTVAQGSARYSATITVASCPDDHCEGAGTIKLYSKQTKQLVQTFSSEDLSFYLDAPKRQPTVNTVELYGEQSPLIFGDFNFDGSEDLAIRNGNHSSYDGPSYDVYVSASRSRRFIRSAELTALASDNLGMFQVDKARKRLITFQKDGCCWHLTTEYEVVPGQGLSEVMTLEEDARGGEKVLVTTRRKTNGRWTSTTHAYLIKEYYRN